MACCGGDAAAGLRCSRLHASPQVTWTQAIAPPCRYAGLPWLISPMVLRLFITAFHCTVAQWLAVGLVRCPPAQAGA